MRDELDEKCIPVFSRNYEMKSLNYEIKVKDFRLKSKL